MRDSSDEARLRAEAKFKKKEQQTREGDEAWAEYVAAQKGADQKRAHLKALRLAKETADTNPPPEKKAATRAKKPSAP